MPVLLLGPLAGVTADRFSRYRIVVLAQVAFRVQALALAFLTLTGRITAAHVFVLALLWGIIQAFEVPARQSLFIHMVGKEDLLNAISLNSVVFNSTRIAGPSVAGLLIAALGEGMCFLVNAGTFVAVLGSLALLRLPAMVRDITSSPWIHLRDGFRYVHGNRPVLALLLINTLVNIARAGNIASALFRRCHLPQRFPRPGYPDWGCGHRGCCRYPGPRPAYANDGLREVVLYAALTTGLSLMSPCLVSCIPALAHPVWHFWFQPDASERFRQYPHPNSHSATSTAAGSWRCFR